ncbi:FK506-binding protein-like [Grus americana]|uniref:FK506-binding protein-like n=1 Tax=Grus americana TaxID=9117 RepID=UPI002407ADE3|nr:FK506-binding protein-like [Grus americana]
MEGGDSANEEAVLREAANGAAAEEPANGQQAPGGSSNEEGGSAAPANEELGGACAAGKSANGITPLQGSANEGSGSPVSANEQLDRRQAAGDSANEDSRGLRGPADNGSGHQDPTNEIAGCQGPANEAARLQVAANEKPRDPTSAANEVPPNEAATPNKDTVPRAPTNERRDRPVALPAPSNGTADPWDWAREEAWLRAPEGGAQEEEGGGDEEEEEEEGEGEEEEGGDPWAGAGGWWLSPDGAFAKRVLRGGRGLGRPGPGSRCRVRLDPPGAGETLPAGAGGGRWRTLRLGNGEGRWAAALDACLETMAEGERAQLKPAGANVAVGVRLGPFSPAPRFWEEPPAERWREVAAGRDRAAALAATGETATAAGVYVKALRTAVAAGGIPPLPPALAQTKAELHAGLALCQLRLGLPAAAAANAGKALILRPGYLEARFRRALAAAAMSDLDAAVADLTLVLREEPGHAGARRELRRVRGAARERDARLARRLGRLFA